MLHGPVQLSANGRHFAHADGNPFFWLADSWWHAMSSRLSMGGFKALVADRVNKGFNVIQFAVANPCDIGSPRPRRKTGAPSSPPLPGFPMK